MGNWLKNPLFYVFLGVLSMIPVIWIARTSLFSLCYVPLIIAAKMATSQSDPVKRNNLPSKTIRLLSVVAGMISCEIGFSLLLIFQHELSFDFKSSQDDWNLLAIELLLGIAVFIFFFGISDIAGFFIRKLARN